MENQNNGENMSINTTHSLAAVASNHGKRPGTNPIGTGLEARGIHAWFGKHLALENVSLDFAAPKVSTIKMEFFLTLITPLRLRLT